MQIRMNYGARKTVASQAIREANWRKKRAISFSKSHSRIVTSSFGH